MCVRAYYIIYVDENNTLAQMISFNLKIDEITCFVGSERCESLPWHIDCTLAAVNRAAQVAVVSATKHTREMRAEKNSCLPARARRKSCSATLIECDGMRRFSLQCVQNATRHMMYEIDAGRLVCLTNERK